MTSVCLCNQSILRHPKINWYSGTLSTINHKQVYRATSWVHAEPSQPCISNSSLFRMSFCHLYSLYLVGNINTHFNVPNFQNFWGDWVEWFSYILNVACKKSVLVWIYITWTINRKLAIVWLSLLPKWLPSSQFSNRHSPWILFLLLYHQLYGLLFSPLSAPIWEHRVAVITATYTPHLAPQLTICG